MSVYVGISGAYRVKGTDSDDAFRKFTRFSWEMALDSLPRPLAECTPDEAAARRWVSKHYLRDWHRAALKRLDRE